MRNSGRRGRDGLGARLVLQQPCRARETAHNTTATTPWHSRDAPSAEPANLLRDNPVAISIHSHTHTHNLITYKRGFLQWLTRPTAANILQGGAHSGQRVQRVIATVATELTETEMRTQMRCRTAHNHSLTRKIRFSKHNRTRDLCVCDTISDGSS